MYGSVEGNTPLTFTGSNLSTEIGKYTILLDGVECLVSEASIDSVKCTTQPRIGEFLQDPTIEIWIQDKGLAAAEGVIFRYVSLWSASSTWGDLFAPVENESVVVPKGLHLLVDIDTSPKLQLVMVDGGSIIFPPDSDPNHVRTFDAHYIFIHDGYFQAGTEEHPYTSKLIITMHGEKFTPPLPVYGNKVIGVRYGTIDMHGVPRNPTWSTLESTVEPGASQITMHEAVDWQVNDEIVIAATDFYKLSFGGGIEDSSSMKEHEKRRIVDVSGTADNPILTLDSPLQYKHYAAVDMYGTEAFE